MQGEHAHEMLSPRQSHATGRSARCCAMQLIGAGADRRVRKIREGKRHALLSCCRWLHVVVDAAAAAVAFAFRWCDGACRHDARCLYGNLCRCWCHALFCSFGGLFFWNFASLSSSSLLPSVAAPPRDRPLLLLVSSHERTCFSLRPASVAAPHAPALPFPPFHHA